MRATFLALLGGALAALLNATPAAAQTLTCRAPSGGLAFGRVDALATAPTDSTASLEVVCTTLGALPVPVRVSLALQGGSAASFGRSMAAGAGPRYGLFVDPARTLPWGDGDFGTAVLSASGIVTRAAPFRHVFTCYGRLPAGQRASRVGNYRDSVRVVLQYSTD